MACSITPFRYNSTTQLALHSTDYYSTLKNVYYWTPVEPDVPSILGRNLNILLLWSYIECTQHDIDIVQQTAEQCASFDWFPPKVLKFSQKKGESVDEISLMALCFQFKSISITVG